jgi:hypothetical protein
LLGRGRWPFTPCNAKVKNKWSCTSTGPICLQSRYRNNVAFVRLGPYLTAFSCHFLSADLSY